MKNKGAKKLICVVLLLIMVAAFAACGKIDFTYKQNSDGTYTQYISVELDATKLPAGYSVQTAANDLQLAFEDNGYEVKKPSDTKIIATQTYADVDALNKSLLQSGIFVDKDGIVDTENAFMSYREINGVPFVSKKFLEYYNNITIVDILINNAGLTSVQANALIASIENADASYVYITPNKSVKSDADEITRDDNGNYVHKWNLDDEADQGVKITLSAVNGAVWYAIAIIAAAVATLIIALVKTFKKSKPRVD